MYLKLQEISELPKQWNDKVMKGLDSHSKSHPPHCNIFQPKQIFIHTEQPPCVSRCHITYRHHWPGGGAPCVSRLTNCISTCPRDEFALPVQKKKEQIKRQTELRDVQRRGKGDGFNRCSVYLVLIHHSQSCPILRPPGLKACKH